MSFEQKATKDAKRGPAPSTATARASPALICGAYEFEPKRLEPAPQLSPDGLVFKVPESQADRGGSNGAAT
jgi:hypothetical protein